MPAPVFLRGAQGLWTIDGAKFNSDNVAQIDTGNTCKAMVFSEDGSLFAWCNADSTYLLDTQTMQVEHDLGLPKVKAMIFSPRGSILACWCDYTVNKGNGQGNPNLHLYSTQSGQLVKSLIQKKQLNWEPMWTSDEKVCTRNVNNELQFYEDNNFERFANKLHLLKVSSFGMAKKASPTSVAAYVPGSKGQPAFVRLYKYPNFAGLNSALASKTFFKADRVSFYWNNPGSCLLVLTSTETSESSYYGDQGLHFMTTKGDSCMVPMEKTGPIYHVEWAHNNTEFVVVHGYMPAKTTIYNLKCEPVFNFGTGPRNVCAFNPQGNILCLAGFGNLAGNLEFWDYTKRTLISQTKATDTTHFEWAPDGQHMLTSTCAPRLRVGNGYRIWHYSGTLMLQTFTPSHSELWQAAWQPRRQGGNFAISSKTVETSVTEQPKMKTEAYRPPGARGGAPAGVTKPLQEFEPPSHVKKGPPGAGGGEAAAALTKNQKKKAARKAAAQRAANEPTEPSFPDDTPTPPQVGAPASCSSAAPANSGSLDKDKEIRKLNKKIRAIETLIEQQKTGKTLELNQLEKIKTLDSLIKEMNNLQMS